MKVVLLEDVRKVGKKGDVVNVSDGYGQNFLIKNKLAVKETAGAKKILEQQKEEARLQDVSTKHIVEQLREKYDIRVDKRKFINAHPIGALGYSNLKVELYKGVIATIRVHLSEK